MLTNNSRFSFLLRLAFCSALALLPACTSTGPILRIAALDEGPAPQASFTTARDSQQSTPAQSDGAAGGAPGQEPERRTWNDTWTLNIDGSLSSRSIQNDNNEPQQTTTDIGASIAVGRFVSPNLELRASLAASANSPAGDSSFTTGFVYYRLGTILHLAPFEEVDPFVGISVGGTTSYQGDESTSDLSYGAQFGVTYNLSDGYGLTLQHDIDVTPNEAGQVISNRTSLGFVFYF